MRPGVELVLGCRDVAFGFGDLLLEALVGGNLALLGLDRGSDLVPLGQGGLPSGKSVAQGCDIFGPHRPRPPFVLARCRAG